MTTDVTTVDVSWPPSAAALVRKRQQRRLRLARIRRELDAARKAGLEIRHAEKLARADSEANACRGYEASALASDRAEHIGLSQGERP